MNSEYITAGFSSCSCNAGYVPGVILDLFMGRGTVAIVAKRLSRNWVGVELKPEYIQIAQTNIKNEPRPMSLPPAKPQMVAEAVV